MPYKGAVKITPLKNRFEFYSTLPLHSQLKKGTSRGIAHLFII